LHTRKEVSKLHWEGPHVRLDDLEEELGRAGEPSVGGIPNLVPGIKYVPTQETVNAIVEFAHPDWRVRETRVLDLRLPKASSEIFMIDQLEVRIIDELVGSVDLRHDSLSLSGRAGPARRAEGTATPIRTFTGS
jgi:hypothetical protein